MTGPETTTTCACDPPWPTLVVDTGQGRELVEPAPTPGGLSRLFYAHCAQCGATYTDHFRRTRDETDIRTRCATNARRNPPPSLRNSPIHPDTDHNQSPKIG